MMYVNLIFFYVSHLNVSNFFNTFIYCIFYIHMRTFNTLYLSVKHHKPLIYLVT